MTIVLSTCNENRADYIRNLHRSLEVHAPHVRHFVVTVGGKPWKPWPDAWTEHIEDDGPFNLAKARNLAFSVASELDDILIWLDADCIVGSTTIPMYEKWLAKDPSAIAVGDATWLKLWPDQIDDVSSVQALREPEPERIFPKDGEIEYLTERETWLMYGLSFGMTADVWRKSRESFGGFCEEFMGWGPEDTDFAKNAFLNGTPLFLMGGSTIYHQNHAEEWPPVTKIHLVVRNTNLFLSRHGEAPPHVMKEYRKLGLIETDERGYSHVTATEEEISAAARTVKRERTF